MVNWIHGYMDPVEITALKLCASLWKEERGQGQGTCSIQNSPVNLCLKS
jgi:hypothetical protein